MKNRVLILGLFGLFMLGFVNVKAQSIPNYNFESWTNTNGTYFPDDWVTSDQTFILFGIKTKSVTRVTDSHSGSYAMKLSSDTVTIDSFTSTIPGFALTKFPDTYRPAYMTGYYKGLTNAGDTNLVAVEFTKYDSSTGTSDSVGGGFIFLTSSSNYSMFSVPITYFNNNTPDSASIIIFSNSGQKTSNFSYIIVDDLGFTGNVGIADMNLKDRSLLAYPNPAHDQFNLRFNNENAENIVVEAYDLSGRKVKELFAGKVAQGQDNLSLNVSDMANGTYILRVNNGSAVQTERLTVLH